MNIKSDMLLLFQARYFREQDIDGKNSKIRVSHFSLLVASLVLLYNCVTMFCFSTEFRECFYLFARSGQIRTLDELTIIMRSLGMSPTIQELKKYLKDKGKSPFH